MFPIRNNFSIIKLLFITSLSIPILLTTGPFLPDLFLTISIFVFLYYLIRGNKIYVITKKKFFIFFFIFWLFLLLCSALGDIDNYPLSFKSSLPYLRFGIFVVLFTYLSQNFIEFKEKLIISTIVAITICSISGAYQILSVRFELLYEIIDMFNSRSKDEFDYHWRSLGSTKMNRISLPFSDWMVAGSLMMRLFPIALMFVLLKNHLTMRKKIIFNIFFILSSLVILMSGERASIILFIFEILILLILSKKLRNYFKISLVITLIFGSLIVAVDPISKGRLIGQTISNLKGETSEIKKNYLISEHHEKHFIGAWKIFVDNKIFGSGLKGYRFECYNNPKYSQDKDIICSSHPHNNVMQFMSELGIIGLILYSSLFFYFSLMLISYFIKVNFKKISLSKDQEIKMYAFVSLFITFWPLTTSGNFFNNWLSIIYFLPIFFILEKNKES